MHSVSLVSFPQLISRQEGCDGCVYSVVDCFAPHTLTFLHYWKWRMLREFDFDKINGDGARKRQIFINKLCRSHDSSEKIKNKKRYARHKRVVKMIDGLLLLFKCHSMLNLCFNKILPRVRSLSPHTDTHSLQLRIHIWKRQKHEHVHSNTLSLTNSEQTMVNNTDTRYALHIQKNGRGTFEHVPMFEHSAWNRKLHVACRPMYEAE